MRKQGLCLENVEISLLKFAVVVEKHRVMYHIVLYSILLKEKKKKFETDNGESGKQHFSANLKMRVAK